MNDNNNNHENDFCISQDENNRHVDCGPLNERRRRRELFECFINCDEQSHKTSVHKPQPLKRIAIRSGESNRRRLLTSLTARPNRLVVNTLLNLFRYAGQRGRQLCVRFALTSTKPSMVMYVGTLHKVVCKKRTHAKQAVDRPVSRTTHTKNLLTALCPEPHREHIDCLVSGTTQRTC